MEPLWCSRPFTAAKDGLHYSWRGRGPGQEANAIGIYNSETEQWILQPTTGQPPSGSCAGGCISLGDYLYFFGGYKLPESWYNDLHKLDLNTYEWSKVNPHNYPSELPIRKDSGVLVAVDESTLICFGGYGMISRKCQSATRFIRDTRFRGPYGWTNELHLFDVLKGTYYTSMHYTV